MSKLMLMCLMIGSFGSNSAFAAKKFSDEELKQGLSKIYKYDQSKMNIRITKPDCSEVSKYVGKKEEVWVCAMNVFLKSKTEKASKEESRGRKSINYFRGQWVNKVK